MYKYAKQHQGSGHIKKSSRKSRTSLRMAERGGWGVAPWDMQEAQQGCESDRDKIGHGGLFTRMETRVSNTHKHVTQTHKHTQNTQASICIDGGRFDDEIRAQEGSSDRVVYTWTLMAWQRLCGGCGCGCGCMRSHTYTMEGT